MIIGEIHALAAAKRGARCRAGDWVRALSCTRHWLRVGHAPHL